MFCEIQHSIQNAFKQLHLMVKKRKLRRFGHVSVFWLSKDNAAEKSKRNKKKMLTSGKTTLRSGQGWIFLAQLGQLKAGLDGKGLLESRLFCSNDLARS